MRRIRPGFTTRARCLIAGGITAALCGLLFGEVDLIRAGCLVVAGTVRPKVTFKLDAAALSLADFSFPPAAAVPRSAHAGRARAKRSSRRHARCSSETASSTPG